MRCAGLDDDTMFPDVEDGAEMYEARVAAAKAICAACPAQQTCLTVALTRGEEYGVWGGRTPEERDDLLRALEQRLLGGKA